MKSLYFVRHAQSDHVCVDDRTRPLTKVGLADSRKVTEVLKNQKVVRFISSPYIRSVDTIKESAIENGADILMDERFRERKKGLNGNDYGMFKKRWNDFDFHEEDGESLNMVQKRNVEGVLEILNNRINENVVIGTHGTALSTILNYFEPSFCCDDFLRIIDYMPYIIRLDFDETTYIGKEELLIIKKEFNGKSRADIK
jgi:2,3-bisphosphoglycerate-dependent phosphoglycerate mutase